MVSHREPTPPHGALAFFGGRQVTRSKEAGDSATKYIWEAGDFDIQCTGCVVETIV